MAIDLVGMPASRRVGCLRSDAFWPRLGLGWRSREFEQNDAPRFQTDTAETLPAYSTTGRWDHGTCGPAGGASNVESGVHVRFALVQILARLRAERRRGGALPKNGKGTSFGCDKRPPPARDKRKTRPSVHPSVRPSVHPSVRPSVRPSVHPSVHPSIRPSIRPSIQMSVVRHGGFAEGRGELSQGDPWCSKGAVWSSPRSVVMQNGAGNRRNGERGLATYPLRGVATWRARRRGLGGRTELRSGDPRATQAEYSSVRPTVPTSVLPSWHSGATSKTEQ